MANATDEEVAAIEKKIAATLRENGVTNASAVAHDYVTKAKIKAKAKNFELSDSIEGNKENLIEEAKACGLTTAAYARVVAQETIFNNSKLNVSEKIQKLNLLFCALGQVNSAYAAAASYGDVKSIQERDVQRMALGIYAFEDSNDGRRLKYRVDGIEGVFSSYDEALSAKTWNDLKVQSDPTKFMNLDFSGVSKDVSTDSGNKDKDSKPKFDDSYYSAIDSWIEEGNKLNQKRLQILCSRLLIDSLLIQNIIQPYPQNRKAPFFL